MSQTCKNGPGPPTPLRANAGKNQKKTMKVHSWGSSDLLGNKFI